MAAKLFSVYFFAIAGLEVIRAAPLTLNQRNKGQCTKSLGAVSSGIQQMGDALAQLAAQMEPANCTVLLGNDTAPPAVDNSTALCDPTQNVTAGACGAPADAAAAGDAGAKGKKGKKAKGVLAAGEKGKGKKLQKGKDQGAGALSNSTAPANATGVDCANNATVVCDGAAANATAPANATSVDCANNATVVCDGAAVNATAALAGSICNSTALDNSTCLLNSTCLVNATDASNLNATCLGNSTDLANSTVVDCSCLVNATALANSTALLDSSNCTALNDTSAGAVQSAQGHVAGAQGALASMGQDPGAVGQVTGNLTLAMGELAGMNSTSPAVEAMMNQTMTIMGDLAKAAGAMAQNCANT